MTTFVALLRGVNVGGKNMLPMQQFRDLLTTIGCEAVATYIQSGNAVFRHSGSARELSATILASIAAEFGFSPSVFVLTADEFSAVVAANPFVNEDVEPKFLTTWIMRESAANADLNRMNEIATGHEKFLLTESALYLHAPDGVGRSKLAGEIEKCLGVETTARNWRTVVKISELISAVTQV